MSRILGLQGRELIQWVLGVAPGGPRLAVTRSLKDAQVLPMADSNPCWFALHVKVRQERMTAHALQRRGFEQFLPLFKIRRRWSDRIKELEMPLFCRYVFCRFHAEDRLRVLTTPGVEYVVGTGKVPVPISDDQIAALEAVMKSGASAQPWPFLRAGQWVRIEAGTLAGLEGILQDFRGSRRLVISVSLLQRSVAVEIDRLEVSPIAPPHRPLSTILPALI